MSLLESLRKKENRMKTRSGIRVSILFFLLFVPHLAWAGREVPHPLFRIAYHTKGLYIRIPVESVDRTGTLVIASKRVRVSDEALYFDKKGVLKTVSYYQRSGAREILLKGPREYESGGLTQIVSIGYFPYSSSVPEGLSFWRIGLAGSKDIPLRIDDVFPPLFSPLGQKSRVAE